MRILGIDNHVSFQRRPKPDEEQGLKNTIENAYKAIGTTDRVVITHGSCFPALKNDCFIGSPYGNDAKEYTKFLMLYGFNGNQLGPGGELQHYSKGLQTSPYNSSAFAKNPLFIDLEQLTTDKYGHILSKKTLTNITIPPAPNENNYTLTNFDEAEKIYDFALKESFDNFKTNLSKHQPQAIALNKEFQHFLQHNNERLQQEGIFKVLSKIHGTDNFENWNDPIDEDLLRLAAKNNSMAKTRLYQIRTNYKQEIELHKFEQFLATKQIKENKQWRDKQGFKYINDLLVGCSKMDYWRNRDAFIDGFQLGAPQGNDDNPQAWNIPVLNPRKLFIGDELGPAGQFLKDKLYFALEFCENLRIDHAMGLIEPYVIENSSIVYDKDRNIINNPWQNPVNGQYISHMVIDGKPLDDHKNYSCEYIHANGDKTYHSNILNKIVLPTLMELGLDPYDAIWEDLCSQPESFTKVFYEDLNLPGISQLEFSQAEQCPQNNWFLVGSHDSIPAQKMIERDWTKNSNSWNPLYLAGYLHMDNIHAQQRNKFCKKIDQNNQERVKAKFAELMTNKKFQISFSDLFGITDSIYNKAGTTNKTNWKTRITPNFIDQYYKNLAEDNPTALNIPEILKLSLQAKIDMVVSKSNDKNNTRNALNEKYKPLLNDLQKYADILKEPEE